jgi:hypothetical protein
MKKHTTIHRMIKKWDQKIMEECDKRNCHISSKLHISSNNDRHPVTLTFTPLHYISPNHTLLQFTTLVCSVLCVSIVRDIAVISVHN